MQVCIVGTGYVGLVTGLSLAEKGHEVVCVDVDAPRLERINKGQLPIHEPGLDELLHRNLNNRFRVSGDLRSAVLGADITMIAVGTPLVENQIDLSYVKQAAEQIGHILAEHPRYHVVVVKSTVVPGTTADVVTPILEAASGRTAGEHFGVGANPEFLSEGTAVVDFMQPDRIVIGGNDERCRARIAELYAPFPDAPRVETTTSSAEMIKYTSNSLLAALISFSNEIGSLCAAHHGTDVVDVMRGVHLSQYLTTRLPDGRRVPAPIASFLEAGCGFGGSCLPKDVAALVHHGQQRNVSMPLLSATLEINRRQPEQMLHLLRKHYPSLDGVRVAVLGLAFKPDTDDVRESPALSIVRQLAGNMAVVKAYDPIARETASRALGNLPVAYCHSLDQALEEVDAVMLVTRWREFESVPGILARRTPQPLLIDGRRVIPRSAVQRYEGIGA